jgi:hypothetical protein
MPEEGKESGLSVVMLGCRTACLMASSMTGQYSETPNIQRELRFRTARRSVCDQHDDGDVVHNLDADAVGGRVDDGDKSINIHAAQGVR